MRFAAAGFCAAVMCAGVLGAEPGQARSGPKPPDTPAGRQLDGWLAAFNSNDREAIRRFNLAQFAPANLEPLKRDGRTDLYWRAAAHTGGIELARVERFSDCEVMAEAKMKRGGWVRVDLAVDSTPPHKITRIRFGPIAGPSVAVPPGKLSDAQLAQALGEQLDRLAKADEFSGVVVVAHQGKPVFGRAYGLADKEHNRPNTLDTQFSLASMGKMFTAVAVAQLVEEGKLAYDDTVGKHLPDYPNKDVAQRVTVEQLLTHTAGLGDFFNDRWKQRRGALRTVRDYLDLFVDRPLEFAPGSKWQYSNAGYVVLGALIEKVTVQDYYDYVAEHVFKPAGMTRTGFPSPDDPAEDRATGYTNLGPDDKPRPGPRRSNAEHAPGRGNPAGGAWSTAGDLGRFAETLRTGTLVSTSSAARLTEPRPGSGVGPDERYGGGFMVHNVHGQRAFGHFGGFPGVSNALEVYPELGYTVVILSNYDDGAPRVLLPLRDWIARN